MKYDSVKNIFARFISGKPFLRKIFYFILDTMFLRTWHVKKEIKHLYNRNEKIKIFDAGMGFGQYTYFLSKFFKNSNILAVDIKEDQVNECKNFFQKNSADNVTVKLEDLLNINYQEQFDFIISVDVMEHIEDDVTVFRNFAIALKKGGKLLVNTPSDLGGSDVHSDEDKSFIEEHARIGYNKGEIINKLKAAGLEVIRFKYTYGFWGQLSWRLGIKYPILMVGISKVFLFLLPFYYLFTLWFVLGLMKIDILLDNKKGAGILLIAEKSK
ncbi:MAG: class I SAM-dependent methyltransferase [Ignavibacteria bacterium]